MATQTFTRAEIHALSQLSPFELKNKFIELAQEAQDDQPGQKGKSSVQMLNAGRGNPNWVATGPREAFYALGYFSVSESRRVWTADNLGGMPDAAGAHQRFESFVRTHPELPGIELLKECVDYALSQFGFDADAFIHELADSSIADNYPVPGRVLKYTETVLRAYLAKEMYADKNRGESLKLFPTEGGTAAMCYIFDSLMKNGLLHHGDKIALLVPVFTPYIEIPELDTYGFDVTRVEASLFAETGVREWRYPEEEIAKLADPDIKMVCLVNPSNPPSLELGDRARRQIIEIVGTSNPNLIIVTDDVYGTFVEGFHSIAADLPRNTLLVYSYSKHYGATGWRLGVIGLDDDNVIDELIAAQSQEDKDRLNKRYGSLSLEPEKIKFIDRLVADSRQVALNHTAGLSLPQQMMMVLFSLFDLLDQGQDYKYRVRDIVQRRLDLLLEGVKLTVNDDPHRAGYYIELDLLAEAQLAFGQEFVDFLQANYEPVDPLFRLSSKTGVVLLNGGGFDGPEWSVRVSLANLDDLDYLKIGHHLQTIMDDYAQDWQDSKAKTAAEKK